MDKENQLSSIKSLRDSVHNSQQEIELSVNSLHNNISNLLVNVNLLEFEGVVTNFIEEETVRSGLFNKVQLANQFVFQKLSEIKFFDNNSSYFKGFFSSEFSAKDKLRWLDIEKSLANIYDSESGLIRQVQDHFLFQVTSSDLAKLLDKESISLEEELFLRAILVKGYLTNLRKLILPFYEVNDKLLVKFKKDCISKLAEQKILDPDNYQITEEISLLNSQISRLELQSSSETKNEESKFAITNQNISAFNLKLNTGSVTLGTIETTRYFTSFLGHKTNIDSLKKLGNFGLKGTSLFAHCLPFVSATVEAGTQMNNNYIVYDYEKKLRTISVIENVKRNLLILEQQATNHYFDNILSRLQKSIIANHNKNAELVDFHYQNYLAQKDNRLDINENIKKVEFEHYQIVSELTNEKDKEILEREEKIFNLDLELSFLQREIVLAKRNLVTIESEKKHEEERLNRSIAAVNEDLILTKDLLESEKESIRLREKNADQAIKNTFSGDLKTALFFETEKKKELEMTVNILLKKQNHLENEINFLQSHLSSLREELKDQKVCNEATVDNLTHKASKFQRDLLTKSKEFNNFRSKHSQLEWIEKDYPEKVKEIEQYRTELSNYHRLTVENHKLTQDFNNLKEAITFKESLLLLRNGRITKLEREISQVQTNFQVFKNNNSRPYFNNDLLLSFSSITKVSLIIITSLLSLKIAFSIINSVVNLFKKKNKRI